MAWRFDRVWQHDRPYQWLARHGQVHQRATAGLINPAEMIFSRRDPLYGLRSVIRSAVFDQIVRADPAASFIFTDALSGRCLRHAAVRCLSRTGGQASGAAGIGRARLLRRGERASACDVRVERLKLTDVTTLRSLRAERRLLRDRTCELFEIDVTTLSPEDVAQKIAGMVVAGRG